MIFESFIKIFDFFKFLYIYHFYRPKIIFLIEFMKQRNKIKITFQIILKTNSIFGIKIYFPAGLLGNMSSSDAFAITSFAAFVKISDRFFSKLGIISPMK